MTKVVFVGYLPTKNNVHNQVAFVGTKCLPRLASWIKVINPDFYVCLNSSPEELQAVTKLYASGFRVIALGGVASARLSSHNVNHLEIPHPSGHSKLMAKHQPVSIETWLDLAKTYIEAYIGDAA